MPTHRIKERAIIAQLVIDLIKTVHEGRMGGPSLAGSVETMLISGAVLLGTAVGRPKTAAAIGRLLKIPRATVQRKLQVLLDEGVVEIGIGGGWWITDHPNDAYIDRSLALIAGAAAKIPPKVSANSGTKRPK